MSQVEKVIKLLEYVDNEIESPMPHLPPIRDAIKEVLAVLQVWKQE